MKRKFKDFEYVTSKNEDHNLLGFEPIIRVNPNDQAPTVLILGSFPSVKSYGKHLSTKDIKLRGGNGSQNFGNPRNSFFNIVGSALGFSRSEIKYQEQLRVFTRKRFSLWDIIGSCKRKGSLDSAIDFKVQVSFAHTVLKKSARGRPIQINNTSNSLLINDIPGLVKDNLSIRKLVFHHTAASILTRNKIWKIFLRRWNSLLPEIKMHCYSFRKSAATTLKVFQKKIKFIEINGINERPDNSIEIMVLPSTSPACAKLRPDVKEKLWHQDCFDYHRPPPYYQCLACNKNSDHWLTDCPDKKRWKDRIRESKLGEANGRWYI